MTKYAELDDDGYPTEETLETISKWEPIDLHGLMKFIEPIFATYGKVHREGDLYILATGGWSGCESAIQAIQSNTIFWVIHWNLSKRGGHYEFGKDLVYDV